MIYNSLKWLVNALPPLRRWLNDNRVTLNKLKRTPEQNCVLPELIPKYRSQRVKTMYGGCYMCNGIFVKADNNLGCSCMIGYYYSLGDISKLNMAEFIEGPLIQYIRESFREGYEPFSFCKYCVSRSTHYPENADSDNPHSSDVQNLTIHVEPSNRCNLWCEACICTDERKSVNTPNRGELEYRTFHKMLSEIKSTSINIKVVAFVGFGEPLFNSQLPAMARLVRSLYPDCYIYLDTNANFGIKRADEISNCGINEIRLALDGVDQVTYETYRKGGDFNRAIIFTQKLLALIRNNGSSTHAIWKYILFKHNDKDEHILRAIKMANDIGIDISFDLTAGDLASSRPLSEIQSIVKSSKISMNLDAKFIAINQAQAE